MQYKRGHNPKSQENLIHQGRPNSKDVYGEPKIKRTLSVTQTGWNLASSKIKQLGYKSVSEFLEEWGREL